MASFTSIFTGNQIESRLANYGICENSSDSSIKNVILTQINGNSVDFELSIGNTIKVKFTNSNTATSPFLNVNDTGAKPIKLFGDTPVGDTPAKS